MKNLKPHLKTGNPYQYNHIKRKLEQMENNPQPKKESPKELTYLQSIIKQENSK